MYMYGDVVSFCLCVNGYKCMHFCPLIHVHNNMQKLKFHPKYNLNHINAHMHTLHHTYTETIVGVNKYKLEKEVPVEVLSIENPKVIAVQKAKLEKLHTTRDKRAVEAALNALTECASGAGKQAIMRHGLTTPYLMVLCIKLMGTADSCFSLIGPHISAVQHYNFIKGTHNMLLANVFSIPPSCENAYR